MGLFSLLLVAAFVFVLGNLVLVPLWLALTTLAGALGTPGRFLSIAGNRRLRQNHALEHATLNVLEERYGRPQRLTGQANAGGFVLRGYADPDTVRWAAEEGLARLKRGERGLAVHRGCGTSIAAANLVSSLALLVALLGLGRLSLVNVLLAMVVAQFGGPLLGRLAQRFLTTTARVDDVYITGFRCAVARPGWGFFLADPAQAGLPVVCLVETAVFEAYRGAA